MKTTNIISKLGFAVILFMATTVFNSAMAQKYGGSAYVQVKNKEGERVVINAVISCEYSNESDAKNRLRSDLNQYMAGNQQIDGAITYEINWCNSDDPYKYGGSATAIALSTSGDTRTINVNIDCKYSTKADAKLALEQEFFRSRKGNEQIVSRYVFDLDTCN